MVVQSDDVEAAVGRVLDPHINVPLTEMGMISYIDVSKQGDVEVAITFPCLGCPAWTMLKQQIRNQVIKLDGVRNIKVKVDWEAQWDRSQMSERAKGYAQTHGYRI